MNPPLTIPSGVAAPLRDPHSQVVLRSVSGGYADLTPLALDLATGRIYVQSTDGGVVAPFELSSNALAIARVAAVALAGEPSWARELHEAVQALDPLVRQLGAGGVA